MGHNATVFSYGKQPGNTGVDVNVNVDTDDDVDGSGDAVNADMEGARRHAKHTLPQSTPISVYELKLCDDM
jgi:hypothetical protein